MLCCLRGIPRDQVGQLMGPGVASPLSLLHGTQRPENHGSLIEGSLISHSVGLR